MALNYGGEHPAGLLAKPDYQTDLLSMSGYDKYGTSDVNGMFEPETLHKSLHSLSDPDHGFIHPSHDFRLTLVYRL